MKASLPLGISSFGNQQKVRLPFHTDLTMFPGFQAKEPNAGIYLKQRNVLEGHQKLGEPVKAAGT